MRKLLPIIGLLILGASAFSLFGSEIPSRDPALIWAAGHNLVPLAKLILTRGGDVGERDHMGNTPLHGAVKYPEMVEILLQNGADPNARNLLGETPLHFSVRYGKSVELLLDAGADRSIPNAFGRTALDYCMDRGTGRTNLAVMELLISK